MQLISCKRTRGTVMHVNGTRDSQSYGGGQNTLLHSLFLPSCIRSNLAPAFLGALCGLFLPPRE